MIKIDKKTILRTSVNVAFQLVPLLLITFVIIIPSIDLLTTEISEETQDLVTQTMESYIQDMSLSADYILGLLIVWTLLLTGGLYLVLLYIPYTFGKVADKICDFVEKRNKND